jgi:hypothetical protein
VVEIGTRNLSTLAAEAGPDQAEGTTDHPTCLARHTVIAEEMLLSEAVMMVHLAIEENQCLLVTDMETIVDLLEAASLTEERPTRTVITLPETSTEAHLGKCDMAVENLHAMVTDLVRIETASLTEVATAEVLQDLSEEAETIEIVTSTEAFLPLTGWRKSNAACAKACASSAR